MNDCCLQLLSKAAELECIWWWDEMLSGEAADFKDMNNNNIASEAASREAQDEKGQG